MPRDRVYMDHNATSLLDEDLKKYLNISYANPSSLYLEGRQARNIIERARSSILQIFNASNSELIFVSSGTEANNMVFNSFPEYAHIVSAIEHPSVLNSAIDPIIIPVTEGGIIELNELEWIIKKLETEKFLVSVMLANNETGVIQLIKEISQLVHEYGGVMHTDAAQGCGKIDVNMEELGVDIMSISPHKFGAFVGVGALLFKKNISIKSLIVGGGQEKKLRSGTENVSAIAAFECVTLKILKLVEIMHEIGVLRDTLEEKIQNICSRVKIFGKENQRLPNTSCIAMPHVSNDVQLMHFDLNGIAMGKGSACSSGIIENKSHVLQAMNVNPKELECAIRISLGYRNNLDDVERLASDWKTLYNKVGML